MYLPTSQGLTLYLCFLMGSFYEFISVLYKALLWPLLTYASPGWFPFLSATNITKLERFHRAANRAIFSFLWSFPIPSQFLSSEAFPPPLRVTLTQFGQSFLMSRLYVSQPPFISGLARLGVKPKLCRFSWRVFASTPPLRLPHAPPLIVP